MPKIIETHQDENGYSFLIKFNKKTSLWLDAYRDNEDDEYSIDWNKYIFFTTDAKDMEDKAFQEDTDNFQTACDLITDYLDSVTDTQ